MKSISVSWATGVQDEEAVQSLSAIVGVITSLYYSRWPWGLIVPIVGLRPFGSWVIPALPEGHPYSSFDWYAESAYDEGQGAVDGERFLDLVVNEPWQAQDHHFDFSLVHQPLRGPTADDDGAALAARPGTAAVLSVDWVRQYGTVESQHLVLRRLSFHGIGLAFGLDQHGPGAQPCAMRPFTGRSDLLGSALEEQAAGAIYCDDHHRALLGVLLSGRGPLN